MCRIGHFLRRLCNRDGLDKVGDLKSDGFLGFGWGSGRVHDGQRGAEADGGRGVGAREDFGDRVDGEVGQAFETFTEVEGAVIVSVGECDFEGDAVAAPVVDGVAVNAGFFGCGGGG